LEGKDLDTSMKLAVCIGKSDLSGDEGKKAEEKILDMLTHLSFGTKFKGMGKDTLKWALEMLTTKREEPLDINMEVYMPREKLALLARREMLVFSAFGSLAPNLFSATGTEYKIGPASNPDHFLDKDEKGDPKNRVVVISAAPPDKCVASWDLVTKKSSVRFEPNERAKESRCYVYKGADKEWIWKMYRETIGTIERSKEDVKGKGKEKVTTLAIGLGESAEQIDNYEW